MESNSAKQDIGRFIKYQVGDLTLDTDRRVVTRDDAEIPLGKLTYEFLLLLIESAPGLVTPEKMAAKLWANRVVTEDSVRQRVKLLRKALSDDASNPRYLNVIRGQGYRLIPDVRCIDDESQLTHSVAIRWPVQSAVAAVLAAVGLTVWMNTAEESLPPPPENSIAVLPFEALTANSDDFYFVDGFHNDLLTQLASIDDLSVISRTSVVEYRDRKKNIRQIGEELGVANILEGSMQRSGTSVRINAQLIDARNDRHIWAKVYDREVSAANLFEIQAEISRAIAQALQVELTAEDFDRLRAAPTENMRAYNYYLLGQHYFGGMARLASFKRAAEAFQQAVDQDPDFSLAWAALAHAHSAIYFFQDHSEERRQQSRAALDRAFLLQPELPEAHLALGYYHYHTARDYAAAQRAWDVAERGMPGDHRIYWARALVYSRAGDNARAIEYLGKSIELDPRNATKLATLALNYSRIREFDRTAVLYDRILHLEPDNPLGYFRMAQLSMWRDGNVTAMHEILDSAPMPVNAHAMEWLAAIYEHDFDVALDLLASWKFDAVDSPLVYRPKSWFFGVTFELRGDIEHAAEQLQLARENMEQLLNRRPDDLRLKITLADILARQGESDRAIDLAMQVLRTLPTTLDAGLGPNFRLYAIKVFVAAGDFDTAIEELDAYLSAPAVWSIEGLLPDPRLDPIRNDPRFIALVQRFVRG